MKITDRIVIGIRCKKVLSKDKMIFKTRLNESAQYNYYVNQNIQLNLIKYICVHILKVKKFIKIYLHIKQNAFRVSPRRIL